MTTTRSSPPAFRYDRLEALVFLVVLPVVNVLLMTSLLVNLDVRGMGIPLTAALRIWAIFAFSLALLRLLARYKLRAFDDDAFWRQLLIHSVVVLGVGFVVGPFIELPASVPRPKIFFVPRMIAILEIAMYLAVVRILKQQQKWFVTRASLHEAELNVLRSQSNPHFLFNTLNLIASEISRDPNNAREIVFDLADLLRSSIKASERRLTTVGEEMELVRLYLSLQQQRFSDRLTFSMQIAPETQNLEIPALLLQPVVENTVKWAVAPFASKARIHVQCAVLDEELSIVFADTGPAFDETQVVEGNGFRILRRTLELNYPGQWRLRLRSTDDGGLLSLRFPCREYVRT